jgi:hypothetical protein
MVEVFGAFTRALRESDLEKCEECWRRHPGWQRQGIVPDLQIGTALYELKGIYGWMPHNAGFDFLDKARAKLGQIHF